MSSFSPPRVDTQQLQRPQRLLHVVDYDGHGTCLNQVWTERTPTYVRQQTQWEYVHNPWEELNSDGD